ncbi:DeoR/GlpR family DNA-binding transcription regulator [Candidatus Epulonipiscium viviparus]|uniref:DeoR/GlpR family DNA-binding transcription regulator n=1 Tax=Candidatus Epulonipiscium viviparus TaxID=420336 RepID=UPI00016C0C5B|nr:DeoR/GlpR family DNA-binding transcription regulator [Candidatus Epulopiscium viviparus]
MKTPQSIINKRRNDIIKYLKTTPSISNDQLSKLLNTSPLTIRRDLKYLEEQHLLIRHYGGATLILPPSYSSEPNKLSSNKERIAQYAATLIQEDDIIFINSSSTALNILDYINDKHVIVVTNNGNILSKNIPYNIEVMLTGGQINPGKQSMIGDFATHILKNISASKCFLGVSGIDYNTGISTAIMQETQINKEMISQTQGSIYIVAESYKILKPNNFSSGSIDQISCLITDSEITEVDRNGFEKVNIPVIIV